MSNKPVPTVTVAECKKALARGDIDLIDVREQDEWDEAHIDGARLIPLSEFEERYAAELPDLDATIFVYCRSGGRSETATRYLIEQGYKNVSNVEGGYLEYESQ
jgi:rhodanese-related sulfurtransferase